MNIKNLDIGVARAMKAYLKEAGASEEDAETRMRAKLAGGMAFVSAKLKEQGDPRYPDPGPAFDELKTWTLANA